MEDDDQGDEANAHDAAKDLAAEAHVEQGEDAPCDVDDNDGPEDAHDVGAANQTVEPIDEGGDHDDVEDVDETDFGEGDG